jgi:hypothetical protein
VPSGQAIYCRLLKIESFHAEIPFLKQWTVQNSKQEESIIQNQHGTGL